MKRVAPIVLGSLLALPAFVTAAPLQQVNNDFNRFFIGADVASTKHTVGIDGYSGDLVEKDKTYNFKAGYWVSDFVAVAIGKVDFGSPELKDLKDYADSSNYARHTVEGDAVTASAILSSPAYANPWRFYAELGLAKWNYSWTVAGKDYGESFSNSVVDDSGIDLFGGLGLAYDITSNLEVKAGMEWYTFNPKLDDLGQYVFEKKEIDTQIDRMIVGLNFQF